MLAPATLLESALRYAELGWPVVPLHTPIDGVCDCPKRSACDKPGKHPRTMHGIDDASTDHAVIERWWKMWPTANIGVHLVRAGLVDIAPDSVIWQAQFVAYGLPPTASFRSGGGDGHEHHLYRRAETCPAYRLCRPDEYDILSNGYAVMPPSMHKSGARYTWMNEPDQVPLAVAPRWAVDMLADSVRRNVVGRNSAVEAVDPDEAPVTLQGEALERWNGEVVSLKHGGQVDRSLSLFYIGKALAEAGATRSAIIRALQDRDEALGWSKYVGRSDATTRYAVIAERAITGNPPRLVIQPAAPPAPVLGPGQSPWRTLAEVVSAAPDRGKQLVDGLLWEMRTHWVYSGPGAGKTLLWLAILMHVADDTKESFCGHRLEHGPVLLIEEDSPDSVIADYVEMLADIYSIDLAKIPFLTNRLKGVRLTDEASLAVVQDMVIKAPWRPLIIGLDACERLVPSDRFTSKELEPVTRFLQWSLERKMTNVMIDHTRKPVGSVEPPDPIDTLYGGRAKSAISDVIMHLSGSIRNQALLTFPKCRGDAPPAISVRFDGSNGFDLTSGKVSLADSERLVMREINNSFGKPLSKAEIADAAKLNEKTVQRALTKLVDMGWVERSGATSTLRFTASKGGPGIFS